MLRLMALVSIVFVTASCALDSPKIEHETLTVSSRDCASGIFIQALSKNIGAVGWSEKRRKIESELNAVAMEIHKGSNVLTDGCSYKMQVLYHVGDAPPLFLSLTYYASYIQRKTPLVCVNRLSPASNRLYPADYKNYPTEEDANNPLLGPQFLAPCFDSNGRIVEYR